MLAKLTRKIDKNQGGITGLETAIILIAFVVVAAVFAYTVLSAGLFSSQKSSEAVYAGLEETQSTLELKGAVLADNLCEITDCETAWASGTTLTTTGTQEGSNCVYFDATSSGTVAYYTTGATYNFSNNHSVRFFMKANAAVAAEDLDFFMSPSTTGGNPSATWNVPAYAGTSSTWAYVELGTPDTGAWTSCTAIRSIGFNSDGTSTADEVSVDIVETEPILSTAAELKAYANELIFTVASALSGEPMDFTTTSDSDNDGLISDETTKTHKVIISYSDEYQYISGLAWSMTSVGQADSDTLLESSEKFQITVDLKQVNNQSGVSSPADTKKIGAHHNFTVEIKPPKGAVLIVERTMPSIIHTLANLT